MVEIQRKTHCGAVGLVDFPLSCYVVLALPSAVIRLPDVEEPLLWS